MLELLSPAGSPEAVVAAVQSGADAIYMGFGPFNARREAHNFTEEEFEAAVQYCRVRGCKVYVTLNTLASDRELAEVAKLAIRASELGADAILVQDFGLMKVLKTVVPDIPLHASTQMSVHSLAGAEAAAALGASRVVLARELNIEQIRYIAQNSPIETEVFVHGALCYCHSGQCYMSSLIGRRSGNRGLCAQPCRLKYSTGGRSTEYPLSLKDNCLIQHLQELEAAGVSCVKIEGRKKRPEYTAVVTEIYARAIKTKLPPTSADLQQLDLAFSRQGFTDGYYTGNKGLDMLGVREEPDGDSRRLFAAARREYSNTERQRVPVNFYAVMAANVPVQIAIEDLDGNHATVQGPVPETATGAGLTAETFEKQLVKTGGSPYVCVKVASSVQPGLFIPTSTLNDMRRQLIAQLTVLRKQLCNRRHQDFPPHPLNAPGYSKPYLNFQVLNAKQLTPKLASLKPHCLYVPLEVMAEHFNRLKLFLDAGSIPVVVLPRIIADSELVKVGLLLKKVRDFGVRQALIGNIGHIKLARMAGFEIRADFGMNLFNSYSMGTMQELGFLSATASFELRLSQIRDLIKPLDTELIVYGRLPLMVSDQCVIQNTYGKCMCDKNIMLSDRKGSRLPVVREFGCRNVILNAHRLYLADKHTAYEHMGLWGVRLMFTTESPHECEDIAESYLGFSSYKPNDATRGLYYRGVE
ncbi:MAG: DUF3656 domain-containing U32 family peptidase [Oscillospiraceae bacterium]|jgi:putative protease